MMQKDNNGRLENSVLKRIQICLLFSNEKEFFTAFGHRHSNKNSFLILFNKCSE